MDGPGSTDPSWPSLVAGHENVVLSHGRALGLEVESPQLLGEALADALAEPRAFAVEGRVTALAESPDLHG